MDLDQLLAHASAEQQHTALHDFLKSFLNPAFSTLPKGEVELLVLNMLEQLGMVSAEPSVYELVSSLRVSRAKARKLIYDRELRRASVESLDARVKALLKKPLLQKDGDLFVLEVENPLVADHLRAWVQQLGFISDGSFSPSLVKLGLDAVTALVAAMIPPDDLEAVRLALVAAGAPDTSFSGVLKATLKKLAAKVADETGAALSDKFSEYWTPIVDGAVEGLTEKVRVLFD